MRDNFTQTHRKDGCAAVVGDRSRDTAEGALCSECILTRRLSLVNGCMSLKSNEPAQDLCVCVYVCLYVYTYVYTHGKHCLW